MAENANFEQLMRWMREADDEAKDLHRHADIMDRQSREYRGLALLAEEKAKLFREMVEASLSSGGPNG